MNITSAQYLQSEFNVGTNTSIKAIIDGIEMYVPLDSANTEYAAILEWVAEGNTIQDAD